MKRKQIEYEKAIELRRKGKSLKKIAKLLNVSVSIVSEWCKGIELTPEQKEKLKYRKANTRHLRKLAKLSHLEKLSRVKLLSNTSKAEIQALSNNELFLTGLALYWAEGFKSLKEGRLGFCNSDPSMIKFMMKWFRKTLKIKKNDFIFRTEFNESHKDREKEIIKFWLKVTGMSFNQFERPFYKHSVWLRKYPNRGTYFGVLRIRVRRSSELLNKTRGWIDGLSHSF